MSTDRQKSFTGTLSCLGDPVTIETIYPGPGLARHRLVARPGAIPTEFYFRVENGVYVIYVRSDILTKGFLVNLNSHGEIAASSSEWAGEIKFDLGGMSLDIMETDTINLWIDVHHGQRVRLKNSREVALHGLPKKYFVTDRTEHSAFFTLNILQRNAPYLDHPDEI